MPGLDYNALREIQRQELASPRLSTVSSSFYSDVSDFLSAKRADAFGSNSVLKIREYENLQKIFISIKEKREEKLVLMVLRGDKINGGVTPEELALFEQLSSNLKGFREKLGIAAAKQEKAIPGIRIIKDTEPYKGLDGNIYGPFKKDEIVSLQKDEMDWLVKAKMAEML